MDFYERVRFVMNHIPYGKAATYGQIARHMGTAREVITRMLKAFQADGLVKLTRGGIELLNEKRLTELAADSLR